MIDNLNDNDWLLSACRNVERKQVAALPITDVEAALLSSAYLVDANENDFWRSSTRAFVRPSFPANACLKDFKIKALKKLCFNIKKWPRSASQQDANEVAWHCLFSYRLFVQSQERID